jgi:hypothetical protein
MKYILLLFLSSISPFSAKSRLHQDINQDIGEVNYYEDETPKINDVIYTGMTY